uniref:DUF7642 domain-containing protein n=1 Tax=Oryza glumipatula TaxID=40148 RepID=A0A0E0BUD1_9ORYZ
MGFTDEIVQVDVLERHLLAGLSPDDYKGISEDEILYDASFEATEDKFVKYQITWWILLSVLLILAWGVGLLMLLYLPIWIYVCRKDFRSRKLCLTPHAIVYKVTRPATFPCFGVLRNEKHVVLHSVSDIVVEQDLRTLVSEGLLAVLVHLLNTRNLNLSRKAYVHDDQQSTSSKPITMSSVPPLGDLILKKLDEVEISVKGLTMGFIGSTIRPTDSNIFSGTSPLTVDLGRHILKR